ncbi:fatty-acyl-CoA synthase [Microbacterium sp. W4I4]|uniref:class I adenylate-forming enzyme family protein n=1 Tax=Microbacterium sp. W4I4 TaxID=3042295 RepID=UPI00277DE5DC|nr:AMP-binding protein [Microbacterium sp. W4I4]MDQ0615152.1 fatty-acyl-CoA synthase [Microbacterium sp. W4I4]
MRTIGDWTRLNARRHPDREAFVGVDGRVTFGQVAERAWKLARGLRAAGVRPGDTVGVLAGNTVFNAETFIGTAISAGIYTAYNWRWAAEELAAGVRESGAAIVIVEDRFRSLLNDALDIISARDDTVALPRVIEQGEVETLRIGDGEAPDVVAPDDPLCLIYTGGSTGTSKAVVLSHRAATANALNEYIDLGIGALPEERGLMVTPMFHSAGLLTWLVTHFVAGKTTVLVDKFDEQEFVEWVGRERATNSFMIPNMMRRLMQAGAFEAPEVQQHFKAMHTGAGLLRMPNKVEFIETMPNAKLFFRYGLSEAGPMVTRLHHDDMLDIDVDGSIGQEYTLVESKLMSIDGEDREIEPGELGEICVRGPSIMTGYHRRPEATAETIVDGWLHTGDLATRDERGYYFFKDRLKEMIKSGGENVYCVEIEQALYLHPAVLEAAVVGVANETWGEEVRAVVSLRDGRTADAQELSAFLRTQLAGYKIPKEFAFMAATDLPRSGAGKLVKEQLKTKLGWN